MDCKNSIDWNSIAHISMVYNSMVYNSMLYNIMINNSMTNNNMGGCLENQNNLLCWQVVPICKTTGSFFSVVVPNNQNNYGCSDLQNNWLFRFAEQPSISYGQPSFPLEKNDYIIVMELFLFREQLTTKIQKYYFSNGNKGYINFSVEPLHINILYDEVLHINNNTLYINMRGGGNI